MFGDPKQLAFAIHLERDLVEYDVKRHQLLLPQGMAPMVLKKAWLRINISFSTFFLMLKLQVNIKSIYG